MSRCHGHYGLLHCKSPPAGAEVTHARAPWQAELAEVRRTTAELQEEFAELLDDNAALTTHGNVRQKIHHHLKVNPTLEPESAAESAAESAVEQGHVPQAEHRA
eukprot:1176387-Prorocentrum_minimum.AAC.2